MRPHSPEQSAREVLGRYPLVPAGAGLVPLGNHGGFSGARLWRVECAAGPFCLRAWPPAEPSPERLDSIHRLMRRARDAGLDCVPALLSSEAGRGWVGHAGRLWEMTTWAPGRADFFENPSHSRLEAAFTTLARLHLAWAPGGPAGAPCPGVYRRLERAREWLALVEAGWRLPPRAAMNLPEVHPLAERAWGVVRSRVIELPGLLAPWGERPLPVQPCLCDVREEHLLFQGDRVTGLVDFGAVKPDHVSVDLARLLGSMAGDDPGRRETALRAYTRLHRLSAEEEGLIDVLDRTGTLLGIANWLTWLYRERRAYEDPQAVARRLEELVRRVEGWETLGARR